MTAALATLTYPTNTPEVVRKAGDWSVPLGDGEVPLGQLLAGLPDIDFDGPESAIRAVDHHWGRLMDNLSASRKPGKK